MQFDAPSILFLMLTHPYRHRQTHAFSYDIPPLVQSNILHLNRLLQYEPLVASSGSIDSPSNEGWLRCKLVMPCSSRPGRMPTWAVSREGQGASVAEGYADLI